MNQQETKGNSSEQWRILRLLHPEKYCEKCIEAIIKKREECNSYSRNSEGELARKALDELRELLTSFIATRNAFHVEFEMSEIDKLLFPGTRKGNEPVDKDFMEAFRHDVKHIYPSLTVQDFADPITNIAKIANSLSGTANSLSENANVLSRKANIINVLSLIVALASIICAIFAVAK